MISIDTTSSHTEQLAPSVAPSRRELLTLIPGTDSAYLLVLDNSSLTKFKECPTSWLFYAVYGREAHAKNAALSFGGGTHVGLEDLHRGPLPDESPESFAARWQQNVIDFFSRNPPPPDEYRTPSTCIEVLKHYQWRSQFDDYKLSLLSDSSGLIVERPFELPLCTIPVNSTLKLPAWNEPRFVSQIHVAWSGRIDLVAHTHGLNRVVDHKTSSIDGDTFTQSFVLSSQVLGYIWAGRQLWPELDLRAFCLNVIRLKRPSGSTPLMEKGPRGGEPALKFFRCFYEYSPERMDWWKEQTINHVSDIVRCLIRSAFPSHDNQCMGKYGKCQYHDVCVNDHAPNRYKLLHSDLYKSVTWNPTDNR
jgi:hypothetical protein